MSEQRNSTSVELSQAVCSSKRESVVSKERVSSIYILRFICCLLVVIIHTPKDLFGELTRPLELIAVPTFFLLSGYFLYREDDKVLYEKAKLSAVKILWLTFALNLIYWIYRFPLEGNPLDSACRIVKQIILGREILSVLWFMTDLLTGLILIIIVYKFKLQQYLFLSFLIIPILLLLTTYNPLLCLGEACNPILKDTYHLLPMSLPYFWIGFFVRRNQKSLTKPTYPWGIFSLVLITISYLEMSFIKEHMRGNIGLEYISTTPLCVSVFLFMLQHPNLGKNTIAERIGESDSARIYYFHMMFVILLPGLLGRLGMTLGYYEAGFLLVFPLTLFLSKIIGWGQKRAGIDFF